MAPTATAYQRYKRHDVLMANPVELIVMLYNGCIKQLKLAQIAIGENNMEQTNVSLQKAQDIVMELMMSLDLSYEISGELMNLYEFISREIVLINASKDVQSIGPIIEMLSSLRDAWTQVQKECRNPMQVVTES